MLKKSTNNTFDKGLLMDFNPIVTPNNVLTNCLNGTIITYNGNEYVLQNDMGNGRVETAYLPEGYIPMGTAELGGIIYIVSYNPLKGVCQIGSFPSPERNLTSDEFQEQTTSLSISNFYKEQKDSYTYEDSIILTQQRLILSDKFIYPGDKFQISSIDLNPSLNYLSAFCTGSDKNQYLNPKYLKLSVISISEEGKYENLNDNLIWYPLQDENSESDTEYYIRNIELGGSDEGKVNLDEYRSLTQSNYNIFQGTEKGKLGILAELECIDTFSCGYNISQEVYPSDNTQIRYSPKLYLNWTYTNPINSNKINLYGVRVRLYQEGVDALDKTQYIIIPAIYSVNGTINGGDFDICKYPNEVEFLNYNSDIPSELKSDLTKIAEFGAATDQQEWIRLNQDWLRIKGWYTPTLTPNLLRGYIENYITTAKEYINQYLSPRQNNGDDSQIEIDLSTFNLSLDTINSNNILHLEVTPLMPFGAIEYLTQKYTLDLQKIGTGTFDFVRYQYQNYESENIMNIGINTYPEEGASFQDLSVEFYSLTQDIYDRLVDEDTNSHLYNGGAVFDNCNTIIQRGREVWANKKTALNPEIVCDVISNEDVPHVNNQYIGILTNNTTISLNPDNFADSQIDICKISFKYVKGKEVNTYTYYRIYYPFKEIPQLEEMDYGQSLILEKLLSNLIFAEIGSKNTTTQYSPIIPYTFQESSNLNNVLNEIGINHDIKVDYKSNILNNFLLIISELKIKSLESDHRKLTPQYEINQFGNLENSIESIGDFTYYLSSSSIDITKAKCFIVLRAAAIYKYNRSEPFSISKRVVPLQVAYKGLCGCGTKKFAGVMITEPFQSISSSASEDYDFASGDATTTTCTISDIDNKRGVLTNLLNSGYDAVCLFVTVNDPHNESMKFYIYGDLSTRMIAYSVSRAEVTEGISVMAIILVVKDSSGELHAIALGMNAGLSDEPTYRAHFFDTSTSTDAQLHPAGTPSVLIPITTFTSSYIKNIMDTWFNSLYKIVDGEPKQAPLYVPNIKYVDKVSGSISDIIPTTYNLDGIEYRIADNTTVTLDPSKLINNLFFQKNRSEDVSISIPYNESYDYILDTLSKRPSPYDYILDENENPIQSTFTGSNILGRVERGPLISKEWLLYPDAGTEKSVRPQYYTAADHEEDIFKDSRLVVGIQNESLYVMRNVNREQGAISIISESDDSDGQALQILGIICINGKNVDYL